MKNGVHPMLCQLNAIANYTGHSTDGLRMMREAIVEAFDQISAEIMAREANEGRKEVALEDMF